MLSGDPLRELDGEIDHAPPSGAVLPFARPASLGPAERRVIALAADEGIGALRRPGRIARIARWLFGLRPGQRPLADPRLETLRRAAIVARHRHHLPDAQAAELRACGFSPAEIALIESEAIAGLPGPERLAEKSPRFALRSH